MFNLKINERVNLRLTLNRFILQTEGKGLGLIMNYE